jgi:hypothetical protein
MDCMTTRATALPYLRHACEKSKCLTHTSAHGHTLPPALSHSLSHVHRSAQPAGDSQEQPALSLPFISNRSQAHIPCSCSHPTLFLHLMYSNLSHWFTRQGRSAWRHTPTTNVQSPGRSCSSALPCIAGPTNTPCIPCLRSGWAQHGVVLAVQHMGLHPVGVVPLWWHHGHAHARVAHAPHHPLAHPHVAAWVGPGHASSP